MDAEINTILPFNVNHPSDPDEPITLRQLLTHTSGIQDNWDLVEANWHTNADYPNSLAYSMEAYLTPEGAYYDADKNFLEDGPGEYMEYSNIGTTLAALVAEVYAGKSFETLTNEGIITPLGLTGASWKLSGMQ